MIRDEEKIIAIYREDIQKLKDEIDSLKKCQIDFLRYTILLFGSIASIVGWLSNYIRFDSIRDEPFHLLLYLIIIAVIPIINPYMAWIIIHKCRSIFRIIAYMRLVEEILMGKLALRKYGYIGYETAYRRMREHPWLEARIFPWGTAIIKNFHRYKWWTRRALENARGKIAEGNLISVAGIDQKDTAKALYLGDYYGKQVFLIILLSLIGLMVAESFIFIGIRHHGGLWQLVFQVLAILLGAWFIYHYILLKRYLNELRYRPFSHDAWYDMWLWAYNQLAEEKINPQQQAGLT